MQLALGLFQRQNHREIIGAHTCLSNSRIQRRLWCHSVTEVLQGVSSACTCQVHVRGVITQASTSITD